MTYKRDFKYYRLLEIATTASGKEIKASYIRLAKKHHPDISHSKEGEQKLKEINQAYETLSDLVEKTLYDKNEAECPKCGTYRVSKINQELWNCSACGTKFTYLHKKEIRVCPDCGLTLRYLEATGLWLCQYCERVYSSLELRTVKTYSETVREVYTEATYQENKRKEERERREEKEREQSRRTRETWREREKEREAKTPKTEDRKKKAPFKEQLILKCLVCRTLLESWVPIDQEPVEVECTFCGSHIIVENRHARGETESPSQRVIRELKIGIKNTPIYLEELWQIILGKKNL